MGVVLFHVDSTYAEFMTGGIFICLEFIRL